MGKWKRVDATQAATPFNVSKVICPCGEIIYVTSGVTLDTPAVCPGCDRRYAQVVLMSPSPKRVENGT